LYIWHEIKHPFYLSDRKIIPDAFSERKHFAMVKGFKLGIESKELKAAAG
jgi:hypothetical protein